MLSSKNSKPSNYRIIKNRGFTLLELLFAIAILSVGVFAIFNLIIVSLATTPSSTNYLIAANLAQEGLELVRNIRDSAWVYYETADNDGDGSPDGWVAQDYTSAQYLDKYSCLTLDKQCRVDYQTEGLLDEDSSAYLNVNPSTGVYSYATGGGFQPSLFKRWVELTRGAGLCTELSDPSDCLRVIVGVSWQEKGKDKEVRAEGYLYDWR